MSEYDDGSLRERDYFIHRIAELSPVVIYVFDFIKQRNVYVSQDVFSLYGYRPNEIAKMDDLFSAFLHPEDLPRVKEAMARARQAADQEVIEFEYRILRRDGEWRWVESRLIPFARNALGEVQQAVGVTLDIGERKRSEQRLAYHADLLENVHDAIIATDERLVVTAWNRAAERIYGWRSDEVIGRDVREVVRSEMDARHRDEVLRMVAETGSYSVETIHHRKDGSPIHIEGSVMALQEASGRVTGYVTTHCDITDRKRAQDALRHAQTRIESILKSVADTHILFDRDWRYLYVNEAAVRAIGRPREQILGRTLWEIFPDIVGTELDHHYQRAMDERIFVACDFHYRTMDTWWENRFYPAPEGLSVFATNITERKRAEEELRRQNEVLRTIINNIPVMIRFLGPDVRAQLVNRNWEQTLGWTLEEVQLRNFDLFKDLYPDPRERQRALDFVAAATGQWADFRIRVRDGRMIDATFANIRLSDGTNISIGQDITERKQAEETLRRAYEEVEQRVEERTRQLSEINEALRLEVAERQRAEVERSQLQRRLINAQEEERNRIAREMHDQFGQQLSALNLKIGVLRREYGEQEELGEQLRDLNTIAKGLDRDIDFLVWEMRPTALDDLGLGAALSDYVKRWSKHFGIEADILSNGMEKDRLTDEIESMLYRITQEALTNIAKHAGAENVSVILERRRDHVSLIIEDDGRGFDAEKAFTKQKGLGLVGMRERALLVGGTLEIDSQPGRDTTIIVRVSVPMVTTGKE
jgi:PAS domain S-box-containing protein